MYSDQFHKNTEEQKYQKKFFFYNFFLSSNLQTSVQPMMEEHLTIFLVLSYPVLLIPKQKGLKRIRRPASNRV